MNFTTQTKEKEKYEEKDNGKPYNTKKSMRDKLQNVRSKVGDEIEIDFNLTNLRWAMRSI